MNTLYGKCRRTDTILSVLLLFTSVLLSFNLTMNFRYGASINNVKFQYPKTPLYEDPRRVFQIMI